MPSWITSAPSARVAATLAGLASSGMRISAGRPTVRAARATACAWLPELTAITPFGRCRGHQRKHRVEGAAHLERAGDLEALRLEPTATVQVGGQDRRAPHVASNPLGGGRTCGGVLLEEAVKLRRCPARERAAVAERARRLVSTMPARMTIMPHDHGRAHRLLQQRHAPEHGGHGHEQGDAGGAHGAERVQHVVVEEVGDARAECAQREAPRAATPRIEMHGGQAGRSERDGITSAVRPQLAEARPRTR